MHLFLFQISNKAVCQILQRNPHNAGTLGLFAMAESIYTKKPKMICLLILIKKKYIVWTKPPSIVYKCAIRALSESHYLLYY